jgi:hypothetical protein
LQIGVLKRGILHAETLAVCTGFANGTSPAEHCIVPLLQYQLMARGEADAGMNKLPEKRKMKLAASKIWC